jgi:subtilase family serine protease
MTSISTISLTILLSVSTPLFSQSVAASRAPRILVTSKIDESRPHTLSGNTRGEANAQNDRGKVADDFAMDHMLLQLKRPAERESAFQKYVDELHDSSSPNFHKWLTAGEIGQAYGPAQQDIDAVTGWLQSHGFTVNTVYPNGMTVDFSGTATQVQGAFGTEIHKLEVNGKSHVANMSDPQIPAALAPAVTGVVSLHDFRPHSMKKSRAQYTFTSSGGTQYQAVVPGDLATIYNFSPLYAAGLSGQGQTIAVIEDSNLYSTADWTTFRSTFGLSQYSGGTLSTVHPAPLRGGSNCLNPGYNSDGSEAILDAEWATAAAPSAAVVVASCADSATTSGLLIAIQNLVNGSSPPPIISISFGECEAFNGASANAAFNTVYQQAAAEGVSVLVSAGDDGAAGCDAGTLAATHGIAVSAWASTPYNVAVGGTDFADTYQGTASTYWKATNNTYFDSALSYVPEIPWNDSCASALLATHFGYSTGYGVNGFCGSAIAQKSQYLAVVAGSGGPSGCATGAPSANGVVGGTCQGYAKPAWQSGAAGIPGDGVRDIPDVSFFAGNGIWGHFYVLCYSDTRNGGASCAGAPSSWAGVGGTSVGTPILAGIQAIVNQKMGSAQGNPNPVYYKLAASSLAGSIFNSVNQGDITVNCAGGLNCFGIAFEGRARGTGATFAGNGALSTSSQSFSPAYVAASGWNFATGLGSINAYNLVNNWKAGQ